jgi:hypothetical protein
MQRQGVTDCPIFALYSDHDFGPLTDCLDDGRQQNIFGPGLAKKKPVLQSSLLEAKFSYVYAINITIIYIKIISFNARFGDLHSLLECDVLSNGI